MTWVGWSIWHFRVFAEGIISGQFDYFLFSFATNLFGEPNSRWDFQSVGDQQRACCVTQRKRVFKVSRLVKVQSFAEPGVWAFSNKFSDKKNECFWNTYSVLPLHNTTVSGTNQEWGNAKAMFTPNAFFTDIPHYWWRWYKRQKDYIPNKDGSEQPQRVHCLQQLQVVDLIKGIF